MMLVFVDESGDPGLKIIEGASRYFTIGVVWFDDQEEADACDQRIGLLKRELGYEAGFEFHFSHNSRRQRLAFLQAVSPYSFFYSGIVLNKDPDKLWGDGFKNKESLYKYTSRLVFENIKPYLQEAIVVIDQSGKKEFRSQLAKYLRTRVEIDHKMVRKIKMQDSKNNNLLQLADYVCSVISRKEQGKSDAYEY